MLVDLYLDVKNEDVGCWGMLWKIFLKHLKNVFLFLLFVTPCYAAKLEKNEISR